MSASKPKRRQQDYRTQPGPSRKIDVALRMARWWPNEVPSVQTLQSSFGMSLATAYRWQRAWKDLLT